MFFQEQGKSFKILINPVFVHVSSDFFNESTEAAILEESISGALEELAREVGDTSGPLGACCDIIGGRDESAVGVFYRVWRQGGMRAFAARSNGSIPLALLYVGRELPLVLTSLVRVFP